MIKIYEEIHRAATDDRPRASTNIYYDTRYFLFAARLRRFLDLLADSDRQTIEDQLRDYDVGNFRAGDVVGDLQITLGHFREPGRLTEFLDDPKLLLLTFCAHSPSFRAALDRSDNDSKRGGLPLWSEIYPLIKDCTSSLELFSRSYPFDWRSHLHAFEDHFRSMLREVYNDNQKAAGGALEGVNHSNVGIAEGDLDEIHVITDWEGDHIHHHWALPKEVKQPAVRPSIEYTVTTSGRDPQYHPFVNDYYAIVDRPKLKNTTRRRPTPFVRLPLNSNQTLNQLDITKSIILDEGIHQWPNGASNNIVGVVDFCGAPDNPCAACGMTAPNPTAPADGTVVVDGDGCAEPCPCHCTLADLTAIKNSDPFKNPNDVLVEIYTTPNKGRGVRSLQYIPQDTYVGAYIGEVYPEADPETGGHVDRYGPPDGNGYHFTMQAGLSPQAEDSFKYSIDSAHLGNWTRFMNHSCDANVAFGLANLGQRWAVVCKTAKDIEFWDEITTDYGDDYFINRDLTCRCGLKKICRFTAKKLDIERKKRKREQEEEEEDEEEEEEEEEEAEEEEEEEVSGYERPRTKVPKRSATRGAKASKQAAKQGKAAKISI